MQHVGLDLFSFGNREFLICVDHWSGYPIYSHLRSLSTTSVISTLTSWFNLFGGPPLLEATVDPNSVANFLAFVICIKFAMSYLLFPAQMATALLSCHDL